MRITIISVKYFGAWLLSIRSCPSSSYMHAHLPSLIQKHLCHISSVGTENLEVMVLVYPDAWNSQSHIETHDQAHPSQPSLLRSVCSFLCVTKVMTTIPASVEESQIHKEPLNLSLVIFKSKRCRNLANFFYSNFICIHLISKVHLKEQHSTQICIYQILNTNALTCATGSFLCCAENSSPDRVIHSYQNLLKMSHWLWRLHRCTDF